MDKNFICPICGNKNIEKIGFLNGKPYCRACISFKITNRLIPSEVPKEAPIFIDYELSDEQKNLSDRLILNYKRGIDSLVFAVCGSGKTEISLGVIQYAINCGDKVAFAVPRKDVVIELHNRLKEIFKKNRVISLYGGHHEILEGDIIVLTTHQLFRYEKYFSLIVLDEIDAFPFKNDQVLKNMFFRALKGHYIMMSATPNKDVLELFNTESNKDILRLDIRFHRNPLPVPYFYKVNFLYKYILLIKLMKHYVKNRKPLFVFAPTIEQCETLFNIVKIFIKKGCFVHSKCSDRKNRIDNFRKGKYSYLITTSVLERGVTLKNLQVIVFNSDHKIYDEGTLIQISGRVGRKKDAPAGDVIFICSKVTKEMEKCNEKIRESNKILQDLL